MWETVPSILVAACCLRRKKPKNLEEAIDTAESDETEKKEEEEESDSGETALAIRSQAFETVPDKLFDYGLNRLPPELEGLDPSDFLEQPEQPNLALLPKTVLARFCEMLPPKDFWRLSQTCRLMHWRMMKWCQCTVKELDIVVHEAGRRANGDVRVVMYPEMAYSIYMKHIVFERVNVRIKFCYRHDGIAAFLNEVAVIFGQCRNIKNLEFTFCQNIYLFLLYDWDLVSDWYLPLVRKLLRDTRATRLNLQYLAQTPETTSKVTSYRLEHHAIPPIYKDQPELSPTHRDIVVCEPYETYLMDVPVASIDQMIRYFLDVEGHGILRHEYYYAMEDREELDERMKKIKMWAESKRWTCSWAPSQDTAIKCYYFSDPAVGELFNVIVLPEVLLCHFVPLKL